MYKASCLQLVSGLLVSHSHQQQRQSYESRLTFDPLHSRQEIFLHHAYHYRHHTCRRPGWPRPACGTCCRRRLGDVSCHQQQLQWPFSSLYQHWVQHLLPSSSQRLPRLEVHCFAARWHPADHVSSSSSHLPPSIRGLGSTAELTKGTL